VLTHTAGAPITDSIAISVTDANGVSSTDSLDIAITDSEPTAVADSNTIAEDSTSISGSVLTNDTVGADANATPVTAASTALSYGSLVLNADGSYTYTLDNANATVNALKDGEQLTDSYTYTLTDADGSSTTATLTITIDGHTDGVPSITPVDGNGAATGQASVSELGLISVADTSEATTGSITVSAPDGLASISVGGTNVSAAQLASLATTPLSIDTGVGTLVLTGYDAGTGALAYSYTLNSAQNQPGASESSDAIALTVTDLGGASNSGTLTVQIIDSTPSAVADAASITEDAATNTVTGNVYDNDVIGADTVANAVTPVSTALSYGSLVLNSDGSYTYSLDNANASVNALTPDGHLTDSYTYTITDADGDTSTATLTITINGSNDAPVVTGGAVSGVEDTALVLNWADFGISDVESPTAGLDVQISALPSDGTLELFDGANWVGVTAGQVISSAAILAGNLHFVPDANESGNDGFGGSGTGDQQADYARFTFVALDADGGATPGTVTIDIAPVADTPALNLGTTVVDVAGGTSSDLLIPASTGLNLDYFNAVSTLDPTNVSDANVLESALAGLTPDTSSVVTELGSGASSATAIDIPQDGAYRLTGVVFMEAGHSYELSGYRDDTMLIEIGGTTVLSQGFNNWGTYTSTAFVPTETGYYTLELYVYNGDAQGDISALMSVDGGPAQALSNYSIYTDIGDVAAAGGQYSAFVGTSDGGYYPVRYSEGLEDTPIQLQDVGAALVDTDGSETLAVSVSAIPVGAVLSDGTHSFTATAGATTADVTSWDLANLSITAPTDFNGSFDLTVTATSVETSTGDSASTSDVISVTVLPVNDAPVVGAGSVSVSEEGLAGGLADSLGNPVDTTDLTTQSGTLSLSDAEGDALTVTLSGPDGLTSGGVAITWSGDGTAGSPLIGSAGGTEVLRATIDGNGNYTVTLSAPLDHPSGDGENILGIDLTVTASDGQSSSTNVLTVNVEDDAPDSVTAHTQTLSMLDTNLLIVLDVSGSMATTDGVNGATRLQSAIDSINALLDRYDAFGDVAVRLVTFSSGATAQGAEWMTISEVRTALTNLVANGSTYYDDALSTAQSAFQSAGAIDGAQNVAYFFSDGEPTNSHEIGTVEESAWTNFVYENGINAFSIGIGSGLSSTTSLDPIAYDGLTGQDTDAVLVTNFNQLDAVLGTTVVGSTTGYLHTTGTVGSSSMMGADGGYLESLVSEGTTYTYDPVTDTVSVSGTDRSSFDAATDVLTITTTAGGVLTVNVQTGSYSYTAPPNADLATGGTSLDYTMRDGDGDVSSSSLTINLEQMTMSVGTGTLTGTDGQDKLVGRETVDENVVRGTVAAGTTGTSSGANQFGFTFDESAAGVYVTQILIDLRAGSDGNAYFNTSGSGSYGPTLGSLTGISASNVHITAADGASVMQITFDAGTFTSGDSLHFGVDTNNLGSNNAASFVSAGVEFTVTFSDGTTQTVVYGTDGASGATATASVDSSIPLTGVTIDGGAGNDVLIGTDTADTLVGGTGDDQISGGGGDDHISGGAGNDILTGGLGSDVFEWHLADKGSAGAPSVDHITDFDTASVASGGDAIDLRDLLQGEAHTGTDAGNLGNFIHFEQSGANTVVHVSSSGGFAGGYTAGSEDATIVLDGVDVFSGGLSNDQQVIQDLLTKGKLITD